MLLQGVKMASSPKGKLLPTLLEAFKPEAVFRNSLRVNAGGEFALDLPGPVHQLGELVQRRLRNIEVA
jgi:hypothetical protein